MEQVITKQGLIEASQGVGKSKNSKMFCIGRKSIGKRITITRLKSGECMAYPYQVKREYLGEGKYSDEIRWYISGGRSSYEVKCE